MPAEGPAGEIDAAKETLALRQQIRDAELSMMKAHEGAYINDKDGLDIAERSAPASSWKVSKTATTPRKRSSKSRRKSVWTEVQKTTEKLVNTLLTKPGNFSKELGSTIHAAILQPITHGVVSNVVSDRDHPCHIRPGWPGGASLAAFNSAFGGKKDPAKVSTDLEHHRRRCRKPPLRSML